MNRKELLSCLERHYTRDELMTKCFEVHIDYQEFPTDKLSSFIRELVLYCERSGRQEWLIDLCPDKGTSPSKANSPATLNAHDHATLSDCHENLYALRNVFEEKLPIPQLRESHIAQVGNMALRALSHPGPLKRIMGAVWTKELAETVARVVTLDHRISGRDILKEAKELKDWPPEKQRAFIADRVDKMALIGQLERLILDLEARLQ
jgi:hypothetical protein